MLHFYPITLGVLAAALVSTVVAFTSPASRPRGRLLRVLLPFVGTVAIVLCGTVLEGAAEASGASSWPVYLVYGVLTIQLGLSVGIVVVLRGLRLAAATWVAVSGWCSLCALFISVMSITNDWL